MKASNTEIEIYISDLLPKAQKEFMEAMGLSSESEEDGNYDIFPIATVPIPEEQEG